MTTEKTYLVIASEAKQSYAPEADLDIPEWRLLRRSASRKDESFIITFYVSINYG